MLFMESYMCYCSVRLGVIIVAVLTIFRALALSICLFMMGVKLFEPLIDLFEQDAEYKDRKYVRIFINWMENSPDSCSLVFQIGCYLHIAAAILSIWGSIKLKKWFLLPLALFEIIYFINFTILHIVMMIMLKKQINLGFLIILTLVGCFYILFVGYNTITIVAMFQIISLVQSPRYRELYGEDPFHPLALKTTRTKESHQPLRVLNMHDMTIHDTDIDEQKRLSKLGLWPRRPAPVVSVIPARVRYPQPQIKWWQQQALDTDTDKVQDPSVYGNWQPRELLNGVGGEVQRKNALNRRYAEAQMQRWY
ncbi:uncharacterized protein LOC6497136 [Drosophila ananassae]|uniref:uncharacterized protein LOC6497136 n=1 Tax=Drosophila ananassae TaxID=7217 RepID=UPI0013A5D5AD|nr:uncharacterized protein LOC6497136 [Drosophila ananassae]